MPGFLLYGGFYLPFYLSSRAKLPNTSDIIRLILRDKVIHNYYSGYKYQRKIEKLSEEKKQEMKKFVFDLLYELIELEKIIYMNYTMDLILLKMLLNLAYTMQVNSYKILAMIRHLQKTRLRLNLKY